MTSNCNRYVQETLLFLKIRAKVSKTSEHYEAMDSSRRLIPKEDCEFVEAYVRAFLSALTL